MNYSIEHDHYNIPKTTFKEIIDRPLLHENAFFLDNHGDLCVTIGQYADTVMVHCFNHAGTYSPSKDMIITPVAIKMLYHEHEFSPENY